MGEHRRDEEGAVAGDPAPASAVPSEPGRAVPPPSASPRLVLRVPLVVLGVLPLVALRFGTAPISDPDTLWHVVAGRELWHTWQFAGPDPLSSFAPLPFVYHQWLPELAMAAADRLAGLPGVAWLFQAMLLGFLASMYALCRGQAGLLAAVLATVGAWLGASGSLSPRPQVLGFVLLAVSLGAWLRTAADGRPRWWLLPLTWLWACVHGSWPYAVALALVFTMGMLLDRRVTRRQVRAYLGLAAGLVLVAMLTPVGPRLLATPWAVAQISPFITEWGPTPVTDPSAVVTLAMAGVVALAWVRGRRPVPWTVLLLWLLAVASTLMYARTIAVGAVLVAPLFARVVDQAVPERPSPRPREVWTLAASAAASLVAAALLVPVTAGAPGKVPASFDRLLADLPTGTVVWNVDALGGWLLYAHPNVRPTMDTRAEVYGPDYLAAYQRAMSAYPGWQRTIDRTGARYALVTADVALADALVRRQGWTLLAEQAPYQLLKTP